MATTKPCLLPYGTVSRVFPFAIVLAVASRCFASDPVSFAPKDLVLTHEQVGLGRTVEFGIRNNVPSTVELSKVQTSCGCTKPQYTAGSIPSDTEHDIRFEIDTEGKVPGDHMVNIFITLVIDGVSTIITYPVRFSVAGSATDSLGTGTETVTIPLANRSWPLTKYIVIPYAGSRLTISSPDAGIRVSRILRVQSRKTIVELSLAPTGFGPDYRSSLNVKTEFGERSIDVIPLMTNYELKDYYMNRNSAGSISK